MSGRSNNTEIDFKGAEQLEIDKLQRQVRIMGQDQQAHVIEAKEQENEKLLKEQEEQQWIPAALKNSSRKWQDSEDTLDLPLLEQKNRLKEKMDNVEQCQKQLQTEISSKESRLVQLTKAGVSSGFPQRSKMKRMKAKHALEANLNKVSIQYNDMMMKNTQLKEKLDSLYLERDDFHKLRNNLTKELERIHKSIGETTKLSDAAAYDARQEALSKRTTLREKEGKDLLQYNTEKQELERIFAHEFNLKNFISTKCSEQSGHFDDKMTAKQFSNGNDPKRSNSGEEFLDNLKEMFEEVQPVMEEDNLDLLVNSLIQAEDRNLASLKFVNEQNSEAEKLKDHVNKIKKEMEKFLLEGQQQKQKHRFLLRGLEDKLKEAEFQADTYENQAEILSKILDEIKTGMNSIFCETGCDHTAVEDKLGFSSGITENNIISYLDLIEEKINDLLTVLAFLKFKEKRKDFNPTELAKSLLGQTPEILEQAISIKPSLSNLESEAEHPVTDEDERPLSQEELRRKITRHRNKSSASTKSSTSLKDQLPA